MTGWLLICIGALALTLTFAVMWRWVEGSEVDPVAEQARILAELRSIEEHRTDHIVDWGES